MAVDDPSSLDDTYDDWRKEAELALFELRSEGYDIKKIAIKIDKLLTWCAENDCRPDSESRTEYATHLQSLRRR